MDMGITEDGSWVETQAFLSAVAPGGADTMIKPEASSKSMEATAPPGSGSTRHPQFSIKTVDPDGPIHHQNWIKPEVKEDGSQQCIFVFSGSENLA